MNLYLQRGHSYELVAVIKERRQHVEDRSFRINQFLQENDNI